MIERLDQLPAVLTSFAYRKEYFPEIEGMLATVREHHPDWRLVTGRGPIAGVDSPTLDVESPYGRSRWTLPVPFELDGSERDWHRIVFMKGWWIAEVWRQFGALLDSRVRRVIWLDADGRLNGPLDLEVEPNAEVFASPWWTHPQTPEAEHHVCSGLLLFQGASGGAVESVINLWATECLKHIELPLLPSPYFPNPMGDQCLLTKVVTAEASLARPYTLLKLQYEKYCGVPDDKTDLCPENALVDQWMMNEKMRKPNNRGVNWPPPEEARRPRPRSSSLGRTETQNQQEECGGWHK